MHLNTLIERLNKRPLVDGTIAGLLGAVVVAAWFLLVDFGHGQPLATPTMLGAVLLHGSAGQDMPAQSVRLAAEYSVFHFGAFLVFGWIAAALLEAAELHAPFFKGVLVLFVCFEVLFLGVLAAMSEFALRMLLWWRILIANILATAVMLRFFAARYPGLAYRLAPPWTRRVCTVSRAGDHAGAGSKGSRM